MYSQNYSDGEFASVEKEQILEKENREEWSHCFIININDCKIIEEQMKGLYYISLNINEMLQSNNGAEFGKQEVDWKK